MKKIARPAIERPGLESQRSRKRLFFDRKISNSIKFILNKFFPYRGIQNFTKLCVSNKSRIIFSGKRIFTTLLFPIFGNRFFNG